jgi:peptidyl-prolyl cis-trans isomerase B (cyclophilin B)
VGTAKRERQKANRQLRLEQMQQEQAKARTKKRIIQISVIVVVFVIGAVVLSLLVSGGDSKDNVAAGDTTTTLATDAPATTAVPPSTIPGGAITGVTPCPEADGSSDRTITFEQAPPLCIDPTKTYTAEVTTNKGALTIDLDATKAPSTVNNFVVLARYHFFDNTVCHRIIPSFVVQCGDPTASGAGGPGYTFADELPSSGSYVVGSVAMANNGPDTNGSQFFLISGADGAALDPNYSLFGQVTKGLDTTLPALDAAGNPDPSAGGVPPLEQVVVQSVTITESLS